MTSAVQPLFVKDVDTLKARLRLSGMPSEKDGQVLLEQALRGASTSMYARLGEARINALLNLGPELDQPVTANNRTFTTACLLEEVVVRLELFSRMPVLFAQGAGVLEQAWNTEGQFRDRDPFALQSQRDELRSSQEKYYELLEVGTDSSESVRAGSIEPDCSKVKVPWGTIYPGDTFEDRQNNRHRNF